MINDESNHFDLNHFAFPTSQVARENMVHANVEPENQWAKSAGLMPSLSRYFSASAGFRLCQCR